MLMICLAARNYVINNIVFLALEGEKRYIVKLLCTYVHLKSHLKCKHIFFPTV